MVLFSDISNGDIITTDDVYAYSGSPPVIDGQITDDDLWIEVPETIGSYPEGDVSIRAKHDGTNLYILAVTMGYGEYLKGLFFEDDGLNPDRSLDSQNEDRKYVGVSGFPDGYRDAHHNTGWGVDSVTHGGAMGTNDGYSYISEWWLPLDTNSVDDIDVSSNETLGFGVGWSWGWPHGYDLSPYDATTWGYLHIIYDPYPMDPVEIMLNSPSNNAIIKQGRTIDLYISGTDITADYTVDGGSSVDLYAPYDFIASGWSEATHTVVVNAQESGGYSTSATFYFTVDITPPEITLISPLNNSFCYAGTIIDFDISDPNLAKVYCKVNDGNEYELYPYYDLYTGGVEDGNYQIYVRANDYAGNIRNEVFNITIDSTRPEIFIDNLNDDFVVKPGFLIEISIEDLGVEGVFYSLGGGSYDEIFFPYLIDTTDWEEGNHTISIVADDLAGNSNYTEIFIIIDSLAPDIGLNSPENNTVITRGYAINLSISDPNLDVVLCSLNDETQEELAEPFNLDTTTWDDGNYIITVSANDQADNSNTQWFNLTIDSVTPEIQLESPENNSFIKRGTQINLTISDENIGKVTYSKNNDKEITLGYPYSIETDDWADEEYTVNIIASDLAGNKIENWFIFTKDSVPPEIILNSPGNNSILETFSVIDFEITDANLKSASYSVNGESFKTLDDPFEIDTNDWDDDEYIIRIKAEDGAGNIGEPWFSIRIDTQEPSVDSNFPKDDGKKIPIDTEIILEFSESMNPDSLKSAFSVSPSTEFTLFWSNDNKTLAINFSEPLKFGTVYEISISTNAEDMAGKSLESEHSFKFKTEEDPDKEGDFPIPMYILVLLLIAIVAIVLIVTLISRKKKKTPDTEIEQQSQAKGTQIESPSTFQVQCSVCSNMLQVNDIGVKMNVTCPSCSSLLTVESRKAPGHITQQQPQIQPTQQPLQQTQGPQIITISCPHCRSSLQVKDIGVPMQVTCPNCTRSFITQSQAASPSAYTPQPLPGTITGGGEQKQTTCPKCAKTFDITITQLPMRINCPFCGAGGTLGYGS